MLFVITPIVICIVICAICFPSTLGLVLQLQKMPFHVKEFQSIGEMTFDFLNRYQRSNIYLYNHIK